MNPVSPNLMSTDERLAEVCRLLALGLARLRARDRTAPDHETARQSSELSAPGGESSLDFARHPSGHATTKRRRRGR